MIFVTTGTQLPFDRLVRAVDDWADGAAPARDIFGQVLPDAQAPYVPRNFETRARLTPAEYGAIFDRAELIVAHAGMGTILTALTRGKAICILPRQARHGEHRNDHQMATARRLGDHPMLFRAEDTDALPGCLDAALAALAAPDAAAQGIAPLADAALTDRLRGFILTGKG